MSIQALVYRLGQITAALQRTAVLLTLLCIGMIGLQSSPAIAATSQPVAYAITSDGTLVEIDTGNRQVLRTIKLPAVADHIVASPDGQHLYVTGLDPTQLITVGQNYSGSATVVWVIDTQTFLITSSIPLDYLAVAGLAISSDGARVYVATTAVDFGTTLYFIDTASSSVTATLMLDDQDGFATGLALAPNGKHAYVPMRGGRGNVGSFAAVDTGTEAIVRLTIPASARVEWYWTAVSPDSAKVFGGASYVDAQSSLVNTDVIFDASTHQQIGTAPFGSDRLNTPLPGSNVVYGTTASTGGVSLSGGSLVVYNVQTNAISGTVPLADYINFLALTPSAKQLYVSNGNAQSVAVIDTATNASLGNVAVALATGLAVTAAPPPFVQMPPTVTLRLAEASVPPNGQTYLTWTSSGATSCTASGDWSGSQQLQGFVRTTPYATTGSHSFTITCTGPGGMAAASATLSVVDSTITFSAPEIVAGGTVVVSWTSFPGADRCTLFTPLDANNLGTSVPTSGSRIVGPLPAGNQVFSLDCLQTGRPETGVSNTVLVDAPGTFGYSNLVLADNLSAISAPGTPPPNGGIDGRGYAVDVTALQSLPAQELTAFGQTLSLGTAGKASAIWGQAIPLGSAKLTALVFLATGINGPQLNQKFLVTYSDGSTTTFTQSLSDWGSGPTFAGEDGLNPATHIATEDSITMADRLTPAGVKQGPAWFLHKYRMPLDGTKVATSLQLPKNRNVVVFAVNASKALQSTAEPISAAYNVTALASAGQPSNGAPRLASGYALDASLVPGTFTGAGTQFTIGTANVPDAVNNATITLVAKSRTALKILATGVNGNQRDQTFVVKYQDGSTASFKQSVSDWGKPQNYTGESLARNTTSRITPTGAQQAGIWDLYAYTLNTDPAKKVVGLVLPTNRNVVVLAVTSQAQ